MLGIESSLTLTKATEEVAWEATSRGTAIVAQGIGELEAPENSDGGKGHRRVACSYHSTEFSLLRASHPVSWSDPSSQYGCHTLADIVHGVAFQLLYCRLVHQTISCECAVQQ